jgi:hypothetical protein
MSSWNSPCCKYVYPKQNKDTPPSAIIGCRVNPTQTSLLQGGSSDQERMSAEVSAACGCKKYSAPAPAYATGGSFRDSSFLTMKYAMQSAKQYTPVVEARGQECCPATRTIGTPNANNQLTQYGPESITFNNNANNLTYDRVIAGKVGGIICNSA